MKWGFWEPERLLEECLLKIKKYNSGYTVRYSEYVQEGTQKS